MKVAVVVLVGVKTVVSASGSGTVNPVETITNGSKRKLAVLTGWPYYQGRFKFHDLRAVMTTDN